LTVRESTWSRRLAIRSIVIGFVAIIAAIMVQMTALVKLNAFAKEMGLQKTLSAQWVHAASIVLPVFPIPAVIFGGLALAIKPLRPLFAILAAIAALLGLILIVLTLGLAMAPMYSIPHDLVARSALRLVS
jgi:hypothetical protein